MSTSRVQPSHDGYHQVGHADPKHEQHTDSESPDNLPSTSNMSYPPTRPPAGRDISFESTAAPSAEYQRNPHQLAFSGPHDPERAQPPTEQELYSKSRNSSWDLLAGIKKIEHSYEEFDSRNASQAHLVRADGDVPKSKVCVRLASCINVN